MAQNPTTYQCECCGRPLSASPWTTAEAEAEAETLWNVKRAAQDHDMARVCDACFQKILTWERYRL